MFSEIVKTLRSPNGAALYPTLRNRILLLCEKARDIGRGYGDFVTQESDELAESFGHIGDNGET